MTVSNNQALPRWNVTDVHESLDARSFTDALELVGADVERLAVLFDELDIRSTERSIEQADGDKADRAIAEFNRVSDALNLLDAYVYSIVSTDSRHEHAQAVMSEINTTGSSLRPLLARLADWVAALGADEIANVSAEAREHLGPLPGPWPPIGACRKPLATWRVRPPPSRPTALPVHHPALLFVYTGGAHSSRQARDSPT